MPILFGSDEETGTLSQYSLYNSAYMVEPDGRTAAVYRKMHLVPFGEYVPLQPLVLLHQAAGGQLHGLLRRRVDGHAAGRRRIA